MFTTGRIVFCLFFLVSFIFVMIWSYQKEKKINSIHFKKSYKIIIALILFFILQFLIVKIKIFF